MPDLTALPPGTRTDIEIRVLEGAVLEPVAGGVLVRSPTQPGFHWGNCLFVTTGDVEDADTWLTTFRTSFPTAPWVAIGLPRMPQTNAWTALGFTPEQEDVLALCGAPEARPLPSGYTSRPLSDQDDWDQLFEMDLAERATAVGFVDDAYATFSRVREDTRRRLIDHGHLTWVGAFAADGSLAASLGVAVLGIERHLARYQSVLTHPAHRRRGLAGHLLGKAADWAQGQGAQEFVIVTELTNPAGRLYRRVGFRPAPSSVEVYQPPPQ